MRRRKQNKSVFPLLLIVIAVVLMCLWVRWRLPLSVGTTFVLSEGQSLAGFYDGLSARERVRMKWFLRNKDEVVRNIQPGSYVFEGTFSPQKILEVFTVGPQLVYEHVTILEGRSSFDIDTMLSTSWKVESGAYRNFITDAEIIGRYVDRYEFLRIAVEERGVLSSLEGYLYPDTYYIEPSKDIVDQLVFLQLEAFNEKVWEPYGAQLRSMSDRLSDMGMNFRLTSYGALILSSIVEKEERYDPNKSDVSAVFFNRLENGMRLDADISLCYGLGDGYEACTPESIVANLRDASNLYNTRMLGGLPPTPICNPSAITIQALVEAEVSDNFYYLHDPTGRIHLSKTLSEHNSKKSKYLQ